MSEPTNKSPRPDGTRTRARRLEGATMSEFIRSITIRVEVDTNKRTHVLELDDDNYAIDEMPEVVREFLTEATS